MGIVEGRTGLTFLEAGREVLDRFLEEAAPTHLPQGVV